MNEISDPTAIVIVLMALGLLVADSALHMGFIVLRTVAAIARAAPRRRASRAGARKHHEDSQVARDADREEPAQHPERPPLLPLALPHASPPPTVRPPIPVAVRDRRGQSPASPPIMYPLLPKAPAAGTAHEAKIEPRTAWGRKPTGKSNHPGRNPGTAAPSDASDAAGRESAPRSKSQPPTPPATTPSPLGTPLVTPPTIPPATDAEPPRTVKTAPQQAPDNKSKQESVSLERSPRASAPPNTNVTADKEPSPRPTTLPPEPPRSDVAGDAMRFDNFDDLLINAGNGTEEGDFDTISSGGASIGSVFDDNEPIFDHFDDPDTEAWAEHPEPGPDLEIELFDYDPEARQRVWGSTPDDVTDSAIRAKQKAAETASRLPFTSQRERNENLRWLTELFRRRHHDATYRAILSAVDSGVDAETLRNMSALRDVWDERPEWWLGRYGWAHSVKSLDNGGTALTWKLARLICEARSDFPPEYMIEDAWIHQWLLLSSQDKGYWNFPQFIETKVTTIDGNGPPPPTWSDLQQPEPDESRDRLSWKQVCREIWKT